MMIQNGQRFFRVETTSHKLLHRWPSIFQIQPTGEVGGFNARREAWFIQFHSYVIFICPMEYAIQIVISYIFIFHSYSYVICHPKFDTAQWIQLDPNGQYAAPSWYNHCMTPSLKRPFRWPTCYARVVRHCELKIVCKFI